MHDDERPPGVDRDDPSVPETAPGTDVPQPQSAETPKREREEAPAQADEAKRARTDHAAAWNQYLQELVEEQTKLQPFAISLPHCARLLQIEIDKLRGEGVGSVAHAQPAPAQTTAPTPQPSKPPPEQPESSGPATGAGDIAGAGGARKPNPPPLYTGGPDGALECCIVSEQEVPGGLLKSIMKVVVPCEKYPGYNFVGRLLGPRGNTLKELQKESGCKMLIRGKGSVKFKDGESEHQQQEIHPHLREPLHVLVDYEGYAVKRDPAFYRALELLAPLLAPPRSDADDLIKQEQLRQLALLNGTQYREPAREDVDPYHPTQGYYAQGQGYDQYGQGHGQGQGHGHYAGYDQYQQHPPPHHQHHHHQGGYGGYGGGGYGGGYGY